MFNENDAIYLSGWKFKNFSHLQSLEVKNKEKYSFCLIETFGPSVLSSIPTVQWGVIWQKLKNNGGLLSKKMF